ncbi:MAG: SatD family protein [Bacteroidota bacterium]
MKMLAVITGDIINSREEKAEHWVKTLKKTLNQYGSEPKNWEIFRGDSFQLSLAPEKALLAALHIKSTIKQTKSLDVKIAIGIGEESYSPKKITEANGTAYVNSGECFDSLKKQTLGIRTPNEQFDRSINIMLGLSLLIANHWSSTVSTVIRTAIEQPEKNQNNLAKLLKRSQSTISEALKRGGFDEIMQMNEFYLDNINSI